jgi:cation:H+ antiporter
VLTAGFGVFMLGLVVLSMEVGTRMPAVGWIGVNSIILIPLYLAGMRMVFKYEKRRVAEFVGTVQDAPHAEISTARAWSMYGLNALFVIAVATYLPYLGEQIARSTGLGETFVGSILIALSTSLPEIVVSFSALRMGAADMAFGNVLGSNLFNVTILGIDDFFYTAGVLTSNVAPANRISAIAAMTMTAIAVVGLTYRATTKRLYLSLDSWAIVAVYVVALAALYAKSG